MNNNLDITDEPENYPVNKLQLIEVLKKKASKNDSPLEKEMRRFNKLVKELEEQETENKRQETEDQSYQDLFLKKVHPMLVELAHTQLAFIDKLEAVFYANKFSKSQEQFFLAFAIPVLQDAGHYLDAAREKMNNYVNWQQTLVSKQDKSPANLHDREADVLTPEEEEAAWEQWEQIQDYSTRSKPPAIDELEKKSVSELYKELAKMIHPDLEQDATLRHSKEQLMKELTAAKEKEDVHAMLIIRQKADAINKNAGSSQSYTLQLLKMYNSSMKKKLELLKRSLQQKIFQSFGSKEFFCAHGRKPVNVEARIKNDIIQIKELQQNLQVNTRVINTAADLKELLQQL